MSVVVSLSFFLIRLSLSLSSSSATQYRYVSHIVICRYLSVNSVAAPGAACCTYRPTLIVVCEQTPLKHSSSPPLVWRRWYHGTILQPARTRLEMVNGARQAPAAVLSFLCGSKTGAARRRFC
jgi:hypothetical protein